MKEIIINRLIIPFAVLLIFGSFFIPTIKWWVLYKNTSKDVNSLGVVIDREMTLPFVNEMLSEVGLKTRMFGQKVKVPAGTKILALDTRGTNTIVVTDRVLKPAKNEILIIPTTEYERLKFERASLDPYYTIDAISRATTNYPWLRP